MGEATVPATATAEATPTGPAPAQSAEATTQAKQNADAAAARKAFEAERAKLIADHTAALKAQEDRLAELSKTFQAERDWRMGVLDGRAKQAGVTETVSKLAKEKGPAEYEAVIAEFEKVKATVTPTTTEAPKPKPVEQPGGEVGGSAGINLNLDLIDPTTNPHGMASAAKAYELACKQYTRKVVDDALAKRASQRR